MSTARGIRSHGRSGLRRRESSIPPDSLGDGRTSTGFAHSLSAGRRLSRLARQGFRGSRRLLARLRLPSDGVVPRADEDPVAFRDSRLLARRFSQLLPGAAATILLFYRSGHRCGRCTQLAVARPVGAVGASLTYWQNWALTAASVDYYARTETFPSPLQHFWSLSVQGRSSSCGTVVIVGGVALSQAMGWSPRRVLIAVFGAVFAASFAYSVALVAINQRSRTSTRSRGCGSSRSALSPHSSCLL